MAEHGFEEQLTKYLTDAHSVELQAVEQLRFAPGMAGDADLTAIYAEHLDESRQHERLVRDELRRRGARPSTVKDLAGRVGGWGMVLFAKVNPDTPGKLAAHAYSYEHMELATYELLQRFAGRAGDDRLAALAVRIGADERAMADRVGARWDLAVDASLAEKGAGDLREEIVKYLRDAHALEGQSLQLLESGPRIAGFEPLAGVFRDHLAETRMQQQLIDERLEQLGGRPARLQSAALRVGALNLGTFFKVQPDTPAKLAGFAFAFEALEAGAYELLARTARRAGDEDTEALALGILDNERTQMARVAATWDAAVDEVIAQRVAS